MASYDRFNYTPVGTSKREGADAPLSPTTGSIGSTDRTTRMLNAMKQVESGGDYDVVSADKGRGAYQFMDATWKQWSNEYNSGKGELEQTPENQDAVARHRVEKWIKQGLTNEEIAAKWNSGSSKNWKKKVGTNKAGVKYNVPAHVKKVMDEFNKSDEGSDIKSARDRAKKNEYGSYVDELNVDKEAGQIEEPIAKDLDPSHLPMSKQEQDESQQRMLKYLKGSWDVQLKPEMYDPKLYATVRGHVVAAKNAYTLADLNMAKSRIYFKQMEHTDSPHDVTRLNELDKQIEKLEKATADDPYVAKAWGQLAPYIVNSAMEGGKGALTGALISASLAIVAGQVVPGAAALPEEVITVPIALKVGAKVGAALYVTEDMYKLESGAAFNEFRQLGMDEDKARTAARIYGGGSSLMELAQFKMLKRLLPGSDKMVTSAFGKALTRVLNKNRATRTANQAAGVIIPEANVEAGQEFWQNVVQLTASYIEPELDKTDLTPSGRQEFQNILKQNIVDVWASTATAMGVNAIPGAMVNITRSGKTPAVQELGKGRTIIAPEDDYSTPASRAAAMKEYGIEETPDESVQENAPSTGRPSVENLLGVDETSAGTHESPGRSIGPDLQQTPEQSKNQLTGNTALREITNQMKADHEMSGARVEVINNQNKMDAIQQLYEESVQLEDHQSALQHAEDFKEVADDTVDKLGKFMQGKEKKLRSNKATTKVSDITAAQDYTKKLTTQAGNMVNGQLNAVRMQEAQNQMDFEDALHTKPEVMKKALLDAEVVAKNLNKPEASKIYRKVSDSMEQQKWMNTDEFYGKNVNTKKMLELRGDLERKMIKEKDDQKVEGTEKAVDQASMDWITDTLNGKNMYDLAIETEAAIADKQRELKKNAERMTSADPKVQARKPKPKTEGQKKAAGVQAAAKRAKGEKRVSTEKAVATKEAARKSKAAAISKQAAKVRKPVAERPDRTAQAEAKAKAIRKTAREAQTEKVEGRDRPTTVSDVKNPKKTMTILTSDNPQSTKRSSAQNMQARKNLETRLKAMGIDYEIHSSKFEGNREAPFILHGVTKAQAEKLSKGLDQSSFIHVEGDKAHFIDQKEGTTTIDRSRIRRDPGATDNYTQLNGEKLVMPFFEAEEQDGIRIDEIGDGTTTTPKGMAQVTVVDPKMKGFKNTFVVDPNKPIKAQVMTKIKELGEMKEKALNMNVFQISEPAKTKAGELFTSAAIRVDGKVFSGSSTHMSLIMDNAELDKLIDTIPSNEFYSRVNDGFIDADGKFYDRYTASEMAGLDKNDYLISEDFLKNSLAQSGVVLDSKATLSDMMGTMELLEELQEKMKSGKYKFLFDKVKDLGLKTVFLTDNGQYRKHPAVKKEFNNMKALERATTDFEGDLRPTKTGQMTTTGGYKGIFLPAQGTALINLKAIGKSVKSVDEALETVVHESTHALISANWKNMNIAQKINFESDLKLLWDSIPQEFKDRPVDGGSHDIRVVMGVLQADINSDEMVTYALSHPTFAAWLDSMPASPRFRAKSSTIKTLWDALVNLISTKILKMPSKMDELHSILNNHMRLGEKDVKYSKEDTSFAFGANVTQENVQEWHEELAGQAVHASESIVVRDADEAEQVLGFKPDDNVPSVWINSYDTKVYGKGKPKKVTVPAQVVFIADRITSRDHFVRKWMHEQVAHNGLREVFGKNTALFSRFLDQSFTLFSVKDKGALNKVIDLWNFGTINENGVRVLSPQNKRDAAEELIALRAESLTQVTKRGLIARMKSFLKMWLPKRFVDVKGKGKGAGVILSDKDIMGMLEAAKAHVMQGDTKYADFINKALQARAPRVKYAGWKTLPKFMHKDADYKEWVKEVVKQAPKLRKWYDGHMETIRETFGDDSDIFQILLAVTSPQTDVETNVQFAIDSYAYMLGLRDKPGSLYPNKLKERMDNWTSPEAMFRDLESTNFKVTEFGRALLGDEMATVGDIWMYRAFFGDPAVSNKENEATALTKPHVVALRQKLHDLASQLTEETGEVFTPREVQAAIWVYVNSKQTGKDISTIADYQSGLNKPSVKYGGKSPLQWLKNAQPNLSDGILSQKTGVKKIPLAPISPLAKQRIQQIRLELQAKGQKTKYSVDADGYISWTPKSTDMDIQNIADAIVEGGMTLPNYGTKSEWLQETFGFIDNGDGTSTISQKALDLFKSPKTGKVTFPTIRNNLGGFSGAYTREVMFSREVDTAHNKLKDLDAQQMAERDAQFIKTGNDGMSVIGKIHEWRDTATRNVDRFITGLEQEFLEKFGGRKTLVPVVGSGRLVSTGKSNLAQKAFNLYIDSGTGANLSKVEAYLKKLLRKGKKMTHQEMDQVRVMNRMLNMTAGERGWANNNIRPYYEDYFKFAKTNKIIESHVDNYVKRTWNIPDDTEVSWNGVGTTGFTLTANSGKQRSFDSIVDGWERGMTLKADGVLTNLKNYADEIGYTYANRRFVEYMRGMITFKEGALMHEVKDPAWKPPAGYAQVMDRGFAKPGHRVFARKDIAILLNKLGAKPSWQLWNNTLMKGVTMINSAIKSTILSISLFHHLAGMRSYGYGVSGKKFRINGIKAYKRGLAALDSADSKRLEGYNHLGPIVDLLIKEGLTVGRTQDWDEGAIQDSMIESFLGKRTGKLTGIALKKWKSVRLWKQGMTQGLFARVFAGLKAESGSIEFIHKIQVAEKKLGRPLNDAEIKLAAQQTAVLINADFGGLHLSRMGRNPDLQKVAQLFLLAPDWTESNWRTATGMIPGLNNTINKVIGDNPELPGMGKVYRKFWKGVMFRGALTLMLGQAAIMGLFADDDEREEYWDFFKSNLMSWEKFAKGRWASIDYTPLARALGVGDPDKRQVFNILGHFKDMLKITDPISLAKHKVSPMLSAGFDMLSGTDWKGTRFSTLNELIESGVSFTADSKYAPNVSGMALTSTIPSMLGYRIRQSIPIFLSNVVEAAQGESSWLTSMGRASGFDTRDVSHQSPGQRKFEEVRADINEIDKNIRDAESTGDRGLIKEAKQAKKDYGRFDRAKSRMNYARTQLSVVNKKLKALELKQEKGDTFSKTDERKLDRAKRDRDRIYDRFLKVINR